MLQGSLRLPNRPPISCTHVSACAHSQNGLTLLLLPLAVPPVLQCSPPALAGTLVTRRRGCEVQSGVWLVRSPQQGQGGIRPPSPAGLLAPFVIVILAQGLRERATETDRSQLQHERDFLGGCWSRSPDWRSWRTLVKWEQRELWWHVLESSLKMQVFNKIQLKPAP